ncbi:hypothetical protein R8Z50_05170 [Longispora sp. K20-0274]|uniref:hypothetical protein n=1 Tax=Longispora sp. K20-0274 TaxID=3088255 RepID=UPI00399C0651
MSYPQPPDQPPPGAPQYAPPVFVAPQSQPLGFTPPQAPKKSGAGKIVAGVLALVLLLCLGGAALFVVPIVADQGATIALPAKIGNLALDDGPEGKAAVDAMSNAAGSIAGHDSKGALYHDGDKRVIFFGATGLNLRLKGQLDEAFDALHASYMFDLDAGDLGGYIRCGTLNGSTICMWIDHGSIGLAIFMQGEKAASGAQFQEMHKAMLSR